MVYVSIPNYSGCYRGDNNRKLKRGLATKRDGAENNRNKIIYSITEDGRNYLKGWLSNPVEKDELRYETLLKLFFGHEAGVEQTLAHIELFEEKISKELSFLIGATEVLKKKHFRG